MKTQLLKMVFEAMSYGNAQDRESARLAVGAALAEQSAQQEPVYYGDVVGTKEVRSLYLTPQAQRKPLTNKFLEALAEKHVTNCYFDTLAYARSIEAAHDIKENT